MRDFSETISRRRAVQFPSLIVKIMDRNPLELGPPGNPQIWASR